MNEKDFTERQIDRQVASLRKGLENGGSANHSQLLQMAVICLAVVSFFTTAQGMAKYIFDNLAIAYAASAAVQGILLAMNMNLPGYLISIWHSNGGWPVRLFLCIVIVALTSVVLFCSSWLSYVHIADFAHKKSWGTDSELLVQQTYRSELYGAHDYAYAYRTYLEQDLGEKILDLEAVAEKISEKETLEKMALNWKKEKEDYEDTNTTAANYMVTVIDAMEKAINEEPGSASKNSRDLAVKAVTDAQNNINSRMEAIQQELDRLDNRITMYNNQVSSLTNRINRAVAGTNTQSLVDSMNSYLRQIENDTTRQADLQEEYNQLDNASLRLQFYESRLGLTDSTSLISIRNTLLEMQSEFFREDPDEEKLLDTATSVFESLRSAASLNGDDALSYTELLVQMNELILNLKNYSNIKSVEASLGDLITELRTAEYIEENRTAQGESQGALGETESADDGSRQDDGSGEGNGDEDSGETAPEESREQESEPESETDGTENQTEEAEDMDTQKEWKRVWRNRLETLKAQISAMPVYSTAQAAEENGEAKGDLAVSQANILRTYNRSQSSNHLDDMIRLYIADHNALYQGIIYLMSPYKMLALFTMFLAFAFDLGGFVFGFVIQGSNNNCEDGKKNRADYKSRGTGDMDKDTEDPGERPDEACNASWSVMKTKNAYITLTGDYIKRDDVYIYNVFVNGFLRTWEVKDDAPYKAGIYTQDETKESKGALVTPIDQELRFTAQSEGPQDGVYLNCHLGFNEGSLLLIKKDENGEYSRYLTNVNEYLPVHIYNPGKGENMTIRAEQLPLHKIEAAMAVVALNDKGTRIAAIYIMQS